MQAELKGMRALVTGASRGLGAVVARRLAAAGADVAVHYHRTQSGAEATAAAVEEAGGRALRLQADLADPAAVATLMEQLTHEWGGLELVVNNAGAAPVLPWDSITPAQWAEGIGVNLSAPFYVLRHALPLLGQAGGKGAVVNVGSVAGLNGGVFGPAYAAAKAGLIGLTRSAAKDWGARGVRVNCVAPGPIDSTLSAVVPAESLRSMAAATPLGRIGRFDDVASAVLWLLSPANSFITGQTIVVDGGRLMH